MTGLRLSVPACAKINLALYVLGQRPDGYHDIATVMQAISLRDTLTFEPAEELSLTCSVPDLPVDDTNLVTRAVRLLEAVTGRALPLRIGLRKEIPVGAGLGGGSSDAAATLWAANEIFHLGLSVPELMAQGVRLGSDVAFFLTSGQALAEGRGEVLTELDWPVDYRVVVAFPGFPVSAAEGYNRARIRLTNPLGGTRMHRHLTPEGFWNWVRVQGNDLAAGVAAAHPRISEGVDTMRTLGAVFAGMTGSGSAAFGLFPVTDIRDFRSIWPAEGSWYIGSAEPVRTKGLPLPASGAVSQRG